MMVLNLTCRLTFTPWFNYHYNLISLVPIILLFYFISLIRITKVVILFYFGGTVNLLIVLFNFLLLRVQFVTAA